MRRPIICSAIEFDVKISHPVYKVRNSDKLVLCGHRHPHIIGQWVTMTGLPMHAVSYTQGFLTEDNMFVTRDEALMMAQNSGQVGYGRYSSVDLYSEDIY